MSNDKGMSFSDWLHKEKITTMLGESGCANCDAAADSAWKASRTETLKGILRALPDKVSVVGWASTSKILSPKMNEAKGYNDALTEIRALIEKMIGEK